MRDSIRRGLGPLLCALAAAGCKAGGDAAVVAETAGYELSVNEAVSLLAAAPDLPNRPDVVNALAELWVDYVLLGEAARRDSTMAAVDVEPLVRQQVERRLILQLRDSAVAADTAVTEAELRALFEEERPGAGVDASHILLTLPEEATDRQRDSVRREAEAIRQEAASGATPFDALARTHSQDPGSARQGGRVGLIERGQSLPAIEEAIFALEPGRVSELVETPYGIHVFRVDERREPGFDEMAGSFRTRVQERRHARAESVYIADILEQAALRPRAEAAELTRRMAERPGFRLTRRAAGRPLMEYRGGEVTLREVLDFMQSSPPDYRNGVVEAPDEVVEDEVLLGLVQRELLLQRARDMGYTVPPGVRDSLTTVARERFVEAAGRLGILRVTPSPGQSGGDAVEARVQALLREMVAADREVYPLGAIGWALRRQHATRVLESGVDRVVQRVAEARGEPPGGAPSGGSGSEPATTLAPDTSPGG